MLANYAWIVKEEMGGKNGWEEGFAFRRCVLSLLTPGSAQSYAVPTRKSFLSLENHKPREGGNGT